MKVIGWFVAAVLLLAVVAQLLSWAAIALALYGLYRLARAGWRKHRARTAAEAHSRAQILARAELQHRWFLDGDPRGTYGRYPPHLPFQAGIVRGYSPVVIMQRASMKPLDRARSSCPVISS
ncbi:hypothetical protein [Mycobacterium canetti]|uniref:hypothetical protein n=1 Tax=Mycobacterium canetti TaxID=78331 RepID=UPI000303D2BC|nr:hypothetical protein [Mycobacterium canetti]